MKTLKWYKFLKKVIFPIGKGALWGGTLLVTGKISDDMKDPQWGDNFEDAAIAAGGFVIAVAAAFIGVSYYRKKYK